MLNLKGAKVKIINRAVFAAEIKNCKGDVFATVAKKNSQAGPTFHELIDFVNEKGTIIYPGLTQACPKEGFLVKDYIEVIENA